MVEIPLARSPRSPLPVLSILRVCLALLAAGLLPPRLLAQGEGRGTQEDDTIVVDGGERTDTGAATSLDGGSSPDLASASDPLPPCSGVVGDLVWRDLDGDGIQGPDEPGIEGVTVELLDLGGAPLATSTTDAGGLYEFSGLCAGAYRLRVDERTVPAGLEPTPCGVGANQTVDSNCVPIMIVLGSDRASVRSIDFGYLEPRDGEEGCSAGYWKRRKHAASWPAPLEPDTLFNDAFETDAFPGLTLLGALKLRGGRQKALLRQAAAALLNSASPEMTFELWPGEVIDRLQGALSGSHENEQALAYLLDGINARACPLR